MVRTSSEDGWRDEISQPTHDVVEERDVRVEVRDGVELAVNVFRPDTDEPVPAILALAGYGKDVQDLAMPPQPLAESAVWDGVIEAGDTDEIVPRGYAHVVADARGTGDSGGAFRGMMTAQEGRDGHDLVEWMADRPWCDGRVGMAGYSYFSRTTLKTAIEGPPHLDAIFVSHVATDMYDSVYPGGILNLFYYGLWDGRGGSSGFAAPNGVSVVRESLDEGELDRRRQERLADPEIERYPNLYHLLHYPEKNPQFFDMVMQPYDGEYWRDRSIYPFYDDIDVPTHVVGKFPGSSGFWELFEHIDAPKKLLVKPAGPEERPWREDVETYVRWFDHWLKDNDTGIMDGAPIEQFVHGANHWRSDETWPLPEAERTEWYLRHRGGLSMAPERHQPEPDAYLQQPLHLSNEQDSVAYVSPPMPAPLTAIGPVALHFHAAIDQPDTNWMVDLSDVGPAGGETGLGGGYLKASHRAVDEDRSAPGRPAHRHTEAACEPVEPGEVNAYDVALSPVTTRFDPGHRIKVEIHSMESPRDPEMHVHYHPKLNIARTTVHKIYRNETYRSHLSLPVVSMDDTVRTVMRDDDFLGSHG